MIFACRALSLALAVVARALPPSGETHVIGPEYTIPEAWKPCSDCAQGRVFNLFMPIANTTYDCDPNKFPSLKPECRPNCGQMYGPNGTRNVSVYIPATYKDGDEAAVHIDLESVSDGAAAGPFLPGVKYDVLDNLMDAGSLPPFVYISVGLAGPGGISALFGDPCSDDLGTERPIELRTVSDAFAKFISYEVLPWVASQPQITAEYPNLKFTDDPAGRAAEGTSSDGAAAFKMAFLTPDLFGIAISYSGAFVEANPGALNPWNLTNADFWIPPPDGRGLIMAEPLKEGRYSLTVGTRDEGSPEGCISVGGPYCLAPGVSPYDGNPYNNFVVANNKTFEALTRKGYQTRFTLGVDACHAEQRMVYQDLPNAYIWAWAAWKEKQGADKKKGADTAEWKKKRDNVSHEHTPWPMPILACSECGVCTPVCTNCANDTAGPLFLDGATKKQPEEPGLAEVRAHDHSVDTEPVHFMQLPARRVEL